MASGLQVFDASGNIILDATYRVMRIIGSQYITGASGSGGSIPEDDRLNQGAWLAFQPDVTSGDGYLNRGVVSPRFSFSGGVLSWSYATGANGTFDTYQSGTIFYGAS
jgi:hypothetical protein